MSNYRSKYDVPVASQYSTDSDCDYRDDDRSRYETASDYHGTGESLESRSLGWRSYSEDSDSLQITISRTGDATEEQEQEQDNDDWDDDSDAEDDYFNRDNGSINSRPSIANSSDANSRITAYRRSMNARDGTRNKYIDTYEEDIENDIIMEEDEDEEDDPTWASDDPQGIPPPPNVPPPPSVTEETEFVPTHPTTKPGEQHVYRESSGSNRPKNPQYRYNPTSRGSSSNDFGESSRNRSSSRRDTNSRTNADDMSRDSSIVEQPRQNKAQKSKHNAPPPNKRMATLQKAREHSKVAASGRSSERQDEKRDGPISSSLTGQEEQSVTREMKTPEIQTTPKKSNRTKQVSVTEESMKEESPSGKPPTSKESPRRWKRSSPSTASDSKEDSKSTMKSRFSFKRFSNKSKDKYAPPSPTEADSFSQHAESTGNSEDLSKHTNSSNSILLTTKSQKERKSGLPPLSPRVDESSSKVVAEEEEEKEEEDWADDEPINLKSTKSMFDSLTLDSSYDATSVQSDSNCTTVEEIEVVSGRIGDDMLKAIAEEEPEAIIEEVALGSTTGQSETTPSKSNIRRRLSTKKTMKALAADKRQAREHEKSIETKDSEETKSSKASSRKKSYDESSIAAEARRAVNSNVGELDRKPDTNTRVGELNRKPGTDPHVGELNRKPATNPHVGELSRKPATNPKQEAAGTKSMSESADSNDKPDATTTVNAVSLPYWYECNLPDSCKAVQEYLFPSPKTEQQGKTRTIPKIPATDTATPLEKPTPAMPPSKKKDSSHKEYEGNVDILSEMAKNPAPVTSIEIPSGSKKKLVNASASSLENGDAATDECLTLASFSTITYDIPSPSRFQRMRSKRQERKSNEDKLTKSRRGGKNAAIKKLLCSARTRDFEFDDL